MMHNAFFAPFSQGQVCRRDLRPLMGLASFDLWVDGLEVAEVDELDEGVREAFDRDESGAWDVANDGPNEELAESLPDPVGCLYSSSPFLPQ